MTKLKALLLVGTLKATRELSNTYILSEFLVKHLEKFETECEIIRLVDYNIKAGVYTKIDADDWPLIYEKIMLSDIIIFATPVWWGIQSSEIQKVIERLDELHDEIMDNGKSKLLNKVAGIVVSGDSDGAEHIIGNLTNFFIALGFTTPPFGTLTVLWSGLAKKSEKTKEEIWKYFQDTYTTTAEKAARNLTFMAELLRKNPLPD
jgi:multimeric flavodoxin WrbA